MEPMRKKRLRGVDAPIQQAAETLRQEMTPAEEVLWNALRNRGLNGWKFRRQHPMGKFVLDFYLPAYQLCVEVDGDIHNDSIEHDAERSAYLEAMNCHVLRLRNEEILHDLPHALECIQQAVKDILAAKQTP